MRVRILVSCFVLGLGITHQEELDNSKDTFTYPIEGRLMIPDKTSPAVTKLTLNGGEYETFSRTDGGFVFHDVPPGVYLLDILSTTAVFSQIKVNLPSEPDGKVKCLEYRYPGAPKQPAAYPLQLMAHMRMRYFEKRESFGLHTIFRNPMSYFMVFMLFMMLALPAMMKNMDPEQMKEMQDQMAQNDPNTLLQDPNALLSSLFGGGGKKDED